jgi:opacity protein-like surface antigen
MSIREHGEWGFDVGYMYEEMDVYGSGRYSEAYRSGDYNDLTGEVDWDEWEEYGCGYDESIRLLDLETNTWLASLEYGLCDNWDIYIRAGIADADADVGFRCVEEDEGDEYCCIEKDPVDFDYGFAWQVGAAFTVCRTGPWTFGGRMQFGAAYPDDWTDTYTEEGEGYVEREKITAELDWWQAVAYMGATYELDPALQLYAGGGWQTWHGTLDMDATFSYAIDIQDEWVEVGQGRWDGEYKLKHASAIGVFGLLWVPTDNTDVAVELLIGEAGKWGLGAMAVFALP